MRVKPYDRFTHFARWQGQRKKNQAKPEFLAPLKMIRETPLKNRLGSIIDWPYLIMIMIQLATNLNNNFMIFQQTGTHSHSSEIRGLRSMKSSRETLQNLLYFIYKKAHVVFFIFHFVQLYIFT